MRFVLSLVGPNDFCKTIKESDSYQDIQIAMSSFESNPENRVAYKIEPYHTVHGWTDDVNSFSRRQMIDFGDYRYFYQIVDNGEI